MRLIRLIPVFPAAILMLTALPATSHAQGADSPAPAAKPATREDDANRYTTRSTMFGIGGTNLPETYLSPLEYTGPEVRFMRESIRMTRMWGGRVSTQQFYEGNFSYSKNPTKDSEYLSGDIDWRIGWHYNWTPLPPPCYGRTANRPELRIRLQHEQRQQPCPRQTLDQHSRFREWRYTGSTGFAAASACVTSSTCPSPGLCSRPTTASRTTKYSRSAITTTTYASHGPAMRRASQLLTVDVPIGSGTLRLGYRCDIRQSHVNNLKSHTWSNLFMIGFVKHFRLVKQRDNDSDKLIF